MEKFYTGYSVTDYAFYDPPPFKGKGWQITFEDYPENPSSSSTINGIRYPYKAVVVHAKSQQRAQYVADMIHASSSLLDGSLPFIGYSDVIPFLQSDCNNEAISAGATCSGIPLACRISAKASFRKVYQNALFKYLLSQQTFPTEPMDLDPPHWYPKKHVHISHEYHVRYSYSIVIAYAVLEEIGFEVRASNKNPSFKKGKWNPKVRTDLENRLKKGGVNLTEPFLLIMRDTPTKVERTRSPKSKAKAEWSYGKIRDKEVDLVDAIAYASWLRSKVSAHKLGELASSLSFYDVINVQHLAQRLLLERLGFWHSS